MSVKRVLAGLAALAALVVPLPASAQALASDYTYATRYDAARRVVGTIAPDPDGPTGPLAYAATRTTYDAAGNAIRAEKGELSSWKDESVLPKDWGASFFAQSKVETSYDAMGRKTVEAVWGWDASLTTPAWIERAVTQYGYDTLGRLECTAQRLNPATWGSPLPAACTPGTAGSDGPDRITQTVYDAAGQVLRQVKAVGTPLQQDYVTYTYSANGKPLSVKDANGNVAGYTYDGYDRLVTWAFPSKISTGSVSTTDYEAYTYDPNGNRLTLRKRDGRTLSYTYDALNRVTVKVIPDTCVAGYACTTPPANAVRDVYYGYDLRGLQTFARFDSASGADTVDNAWDGFGRTRSQTTAMAGASRMVGYLYDADGNRIRITHPDGVYFTYDYDGLDRPATVRENGSSAIATMAYDAQGRESSETRGMVTTTFGYDPVSRLATLADDLPGTASDVVTTLAYNAASQLVTKARSNDLYAFNAYSSVSRPYVANGLNQYASGGSATFGYDANGNLVSDGTTGYTYDAENRMVATTFGGGATLAYDPLGRLYAATSGGAEKPYLYDGDQRIAEYTAGVVTMRYVHGAGGDNPLFAYNGAGLSDRRSLQADERGSIVSLVDAAGTVVAINRYDEYGIPGAGNYGKFQYTGQVWIPQVGMYYYKARFYSPTIGRFMQTDPIGYADQHNLYAYVGNDPANRGDPSGLMGDPGDAFDSPSQAAADAIRYINPRSIAENKEYGGYIYEKGGKYFASQPVSSNKGDSVTFTAPKSLNSDYHTHGNYSAVGAGGVPVPTTKANDAYNSDHFSVGLKADTGIAKTLSKVTGDPNYTRYLGTPSGNILVLVRGVESPIVVIPKITPAIPIDRPGINE